ncbi:hypothetical protein BGZ94_006356, partial [Podila epigama]
MSSAQSHAQSSTSTAIAPVVDSASHIATDDSGDTYDDQCLQLSDDEPVSLDKGKKKADKGKQKADKGKQKADKGKRKADKDLEQSAAPDTPKKKRAKTTKAEQTKVNKTSRSERNAEEQQNRMAQALAQGTELNIQKRNRSLGQVINDGLKSLCATVTISK